MNKYLFWNEDSGLRLGVFEGTDELDAFRNHLVDAGYDRGHELHEQWCLEFVNDESDIKYKEVEERYFISIDNVGVFDTIEVFDGFEYQEISHAQQAIKDLKSDPYDEYTYRIYKGCVTSFDENEAALKAYVLEVL